MFTRNERAKRASLAHSYYIHLLETSTYASIVLSLFRSTLDDVVYTLDYVD